MKDCIPRSGTDFRHVLMVVPFGRVANKRLVTIITLYLPYLPSSLVTLEFFPIILTRDEYQGSSPHPQQRCCPSS